MVAPVVHQSGGRGAVSTTFLAVASKAAGFAVLLRFVGSLFLALLSLRPNAATLRVGDPGAVVIDALGEPSSEFDAKRALVDSDFAHFRFTSLTDPSSPPGDASGLPEVDGRALWFPFLTTAGTLVYLDADDRVTAVYAAGT